MSHPASAVASIRWLSIAPWLILVRAARVSIMLRVLLLAVIGVLLTEAGWWVVDRVFFDDPVIAPLVRFADPPIAVPTAADLDVRAGESVALQLEAFGGPLYRGWHWASQPFIQMFRVATWRSWFGLLLDGLWTVAVWALFGGAIARIAALYLTQGEAIGPMAALRSAAVRWLSTAGAPLLALLAIFVVALPLMLAGLLAWFNIFALLEAALWFLALLVGVAIAILAIGLALGWPLMVSTVATERTDAFDAISRGYAYVYQRPLHGLFYVLVAGLLGLLVQAAVTFVVGASLDATHWAFAAGAGQPRTDVLLERPIDDDRDSFPSPEELSARMIRFWNRGLAMFAAAFPLAYLWPAAVGIYLLQRRNIDSTDIAEAKFDEGDPQRGLPPLADDPTTGVPQVATGATGVALPTNRPPGASPPAP
ncbi:MAG TPA: hypothetical protein VF175_06240 [Lacipirellula sp.]